LNKAINEITGKYTSEELIDLFNRITVPVSRINTISEVGTDPLVEKRLLFTRDPVTNTKVTLAPPPHMTPFLEENDRHLSFPPRFGEQNQEIFGQVLGYSDESISRLKEKGII
jgi:crotonobetainyl-CoA:carnitine CoA-transferase CaiB-like acyl-CoA transferase